MRYIDADRFIRSIDTLRELYDFFQKIPYGVLMNMIDKQSNYDTDNVIEQLELHSFSFRDDGNPPCQYVKLEDAVKIVKTGGNNETN